MTLASGDMGEMNNGVLMVMTLVVVKVGGGGCLDGWANKKKRKRKGGTGYRYSQITEPFFFLTLPPIWKFLNHANSIFYIKSKILASNYHNNLCNPFLE